ncbi:MAG: hypothetical protein Q4D06_10075 [Coriobacteriia bacterium]|nr:hypothetical protein [Coriobacteriia bacterium]
MNLARKLTGFLAVLCLMSGCAYLMGASPALSFADEPAGADDPAALTEEDNQTVTVVFKLPNGEAANVPDAKPEWTIDRVFKESKAQTPVAAEEGQQFKGWAYSEDATAPLRTYTLTAEKANAEGGVMSVVILYPVFGPAHDPQVTFLCQDGKTVLSERAIQSRQSLNQANVVPALNVKDGKGNLVLQKKGYSFMGWANEKGEIIYADEPLVDDVKLAPKFAKISSSVSSITSAKADVSGAYLTRSGMEHVTKVSFVLKKAKAASKALKSAATADNHAICNYYHMSFGYTSGGKRVQVKKGFGIVTLTLPVAKANGTEVKLFWLKSDGSVGKSATKKVSKGVVKLNVNDYVAGDYANLVISYKKAEKKTEEKKKTENKKNNTSTNNRNNNSSSYRPSYTRPSYTSSTTSSSDEDDEDDADLDDDEAEEEDDDSDEAAVAGTDGEEGDGGDGAPLDGGDGDGVVDPLAEAEAEAAAAEGEQQPGYAGLLYALGMLLIIAAACGAWWLVNGKQLPPFLAARFGKKDEGLDEDEDLAGEGESGPGVSRTVATPADAAKAAAAGAVAGAAVAGAAGAAKKPGSTAPAAKPAPASSAPMSRIAKPAGEAAVKSAPIVAKASEAKPGTVAAPMSAGAKVQEAPVIKAENTVQDVPTEFAAPTAVDAPMVDAASAVKEAPVNEAATKVATVMAPTAVSAAKTAELPRVAVAPTNAEPKVEPTAAAFSAAETTQIPVVAAPDTTLEMPKVEVDAPVTFSAPKVVEAPVVSSSSTVQMAPILGGPATAMP